MGKYLRYLIQECPHQRKIARFKTLLAVFYCACGRSRPCFGWFGSPSVSYRAFRHRKKQRGPPASEGAASFIPSSSMTQQWLAAASKCVRRGIRANAAAAVRTSRQVAPAAVQATPSMLRTRAFASVPTPHPSETFLTGANNAYVEEMYAAWKTSPQR